MAPVRDRPMEMYKHMQMNTERIMPIGKSRSGFLHSSADVATASKPMYEKKTMAVPLSIPWTPKGAKGSKLVMSTCGVAIQTKAIIAANVTKTRIVFSLALCFVPLIRTKASNKIMMTAGRLIMPPSAGVFNRTSGIIYP